MVYFINEGRDVTYSLQDKGQAPDWRYVNSCLGELAVPATYL